MKNNKILMIVLIMVFSSCDNHYKTTIPVNLDSLIFTLGQPNQSKELWLEGYDSIYDYYFKYHDLEDKEFKKFDSIEVNYSKEKVIFRLLDEAEQKKLYYLGFLYRQDKDSIFINGLEAKFEMDSIYYKNIGFVINDSNLIGLKISLPAYDLDSNLTRILLKRIALLEYKKLIIFKEMKREQYHKLKGWDKE